jgi:hypothetical protein
VLRSRRRPNDGRSIVLFVRNGEFLEADIRGYELSSEDNLLKYFFAGYLLGMKERGKGR